MKAKIRIQISVIAENMAESGEVIKYFPVEISPDDIVEKSRNVSVLVFVSGMIYSAMKKFFEYNEVK